MATKKNNNTIALLSIQPKYVELILNGIKKVEFRKTKFRNSISIVVVYVTDPVQRIVCCFKVSYLDENTPKNLWGKYKNIGGIMYEDFFSYYNSSEKGLAIGIDKVKTLKNPIQLNSLKKGLKAPQSFSYLPEEDFKKLRITNY